MKKVHVLASLFLLASLVVPALAKEKAPQETTSTVTGVVARVDVAALTVTVKNTSEWSVHGDLQVTKTGASAADRV